MIVFDNYFEVGNTYMHKKAMDVAIEVKKINYKSPDNLSISVSWINLGYQGEPFKPNGDMVQEVLIPIDQKFDWIDITEKMNIKRTKPGVPSEKK